MIHAQQAHNNRAMLNLLVVTRINDDRTTITIDVQYNAYI